LSWGMSFLYLGVGTVALRWRTAACAAIKNRAAAV
jgi:hypothetical protein